MTNIIIKIALGINKLISGTIIEKHIKWGNRHLPLLYILSSLLLLVVSILLYCVYCTTVKDYIIVSAILLVFSVSNIFAYRRYKKRV